MAISYCAVCNHEMRNRRERHICTSCRASLCGQHVYSYIDGNNASITKHSPELCRECYVARYGPQLSARPVSTGLEMVAD